MVKKEVALVFVLILLASVVSASFIIGDLSSDIKEEYAPGEEVRGWINISLDNEEADSLISSNFEGEINLKAFLIENSAEYSCIPSDCEEDYSVMNGEETKIFSLNYGEEKLVAFQVYGQVEDISELKFDVTVNNPDSCINPLEIDIINDGDVEWSSGIVGSDYVCSQGAGRGCFKSEESLSEVYVGSTPYCEKITLTQSSKFKLGAWLKKDASSVYAEDNIEMILYNLNGEELASCDLPEPSAVGEEIGCNIDYRNKKIKSYYVCVRAANEAITKYLTKQEDVNSCGFYAFPGEETEYHDYYIFAKGARFTNIGSFSFNQDEFELQDNSGNLVDYVENYIEDRYDKNCDDGCKIPVRIKAYGNLNVRLNGLSLAYSTGAGAQVPETSIYDADKEAAEISSDFIKLDLKYSNIIVPEKFGKHDFELYLDGSRIVKKEISVEKGLVIKNLLPNVVSAGASTTFVVNVSVPENMSIVSYEWDFGDGDEEETTTNTVQHIYSSIGSYELSITVGDNFGNKASRKFIIISGNPQEVVESTVSEYKGRLSNLTFQISAFPIWYQDLIKSKIDFDNVETEFEVLEKRFNLASRDEEFVEIMSNLSGLKVPIKVGFRSEGILPFFANLDVVDLDNLEAAGAGGYDLDESDEYKRAVIRWVEENLDMTLEFKDVAAYYDYRIESLFGAFKLEMTPVTELSDDLYIVIEGRDIEFSQGYNEKSIDNAVGFVLPDISTRTLEFTVSDVEAEDLALYMSPQLSLLELEIVSVCNFNGRCEPDLGENWTNCRSDCKPWGWVIFLLILLVFIAIGIYMLLQWWYEKRYESHLFKEANDVYNITNFIKNARSEGMSDKDISDKLRKAGWTGEQISYAFKKIAGKAIMPFDFMKFFRKRLEKPEVIKRGKIPAIRQRTI